MLALAAETTRVVDAYGRTVVPGMVDTHTHHNMAGENFLFKLNVGATDSIDEICRAVSEWITSKELSAGDWVTGGGWGATLLNELMKPESLAKLDAAAPRNPVLLRDDSHHQKWANSKALERAGITADTPDPEGGTIHRDKAGAATGVLLESAGGEVDKIRIADSPLSGSEYAARCSKIAIEMLHAVGITAFQDASSTKEVLEGLKQLDDAGELQAWVVTSMPAHDAFFGFELVGEPLMALGEQYRTEHHRPDYTKIWLDGVPMNQSTALLDPYLPSEEFGCDHRGQTNMTFDEFEHWLRYIGAQGLGVKVHATGDGAVRMVLDSVEKVRADGIDVKVQAAHVTFIDPQDVPRFAELNVVAEISPALWNPGILTEAIRAVVPSSLVDQNMYPNRDLVDSGAHVAIGTDWPVPPTPDPWGPIYSLVTRKDPTGSFSGQLNIAQALTVSEALHLYTSASAHAAGLGDVAGRIAPGMSTDFVVLNKDPFEIDVEELKNVHPLETWFAGNRVYSREESHLPTS